MPGVGLAAAAVFGVRAGRLALAAADVLVYGLQSMQVC